MAIALKLEQQKKEEEKEEQVLRTQRNKKVEIC
jgi:hypothetical protein